MDSKNTPGDAPRREFILRLHCLIIQLDYEKLLFPAASSIVKRPFD